MGPPRHTNWGSEQHTMIKIILHLMKVNTGRQDVSPVPVTVIKWSSLIPVFIWDYEEMTQQRGGVSGLYNEEIKHCSKSGSSDWIKLAGLVRGATLKLIKITRKGFSCVRVVQSWTETETSDQDIWYNSQVQLCWLSVLGQTVSDCARWHPRPGSSDKFSCIIWIFLFPHYKSEAADHIKYFSSWQAGWLSVLTWQKTRLLMLIWTKLVVRLKYSPATEETELAW